MRPRKPTRIGLGKAAQDIAARELDETRRVSEGGYGGFDTGRAKEYRSARAFLRRVWSDGRERDRRGERVGGDSRLRPRFVRVVLWVPKVTSSGG